MSLWGWTGAGESADPHLSLRELPHGLMDCVPQPTCMHSDDVTVQWLTPTPRGDLFLIGRACDTDGCGNWLVEKRLTEVVALLQFADDAFQVLPGASVYPDVLVREPAAAAQSTRTRFKWEQGRYIAAQSEVLFIVDGVECGTASECNAKAHALMQAGDAPLAVRIWETVHGLAWI